MALEHRPHADDIIIGGRTLGNFVVYDSAGTAQIACGTVEELLGCAARFTHRQHAQVWCVRDDQTYAPVIDPVLLRRMWSEFVEMPGLRLTPAQARRLWSVSSDTCASALETLVTLKVLVRTPDGNYARPSTTAAAHPVRRAS